MLTAVWVVASARMPAPGSLWLQAPEEVVHLDHVLVAAAEVGHEVVQLIVHLVSLLLAILGRVNKNLLNSVYGWMDNKLSRIELVALY